jgi:hypothetical protein
VNGEHLRAFLWLRWRLRVNQVRRAGAVNAVILAVLAVGACLLAVVFFVLSFLLGWWALGGAQPAAHMYAWDGLVAAYLFFWAAGLLAELQRLEVLSLDKFLRLPVSPAGAFLINYVSSLLTLGLIVFVPMMVGLSLGLVFARGAWMLLLFPLVAVFLLMVTALSYQFQGWLAALMTNKRRRRTVVAVVTIAFVLLMQLPNLASLLGPHGKHPDPQAVAASPQQAELDRAHQAGAIDEAEYKERKAQLAREDDTRSHDEERRTLERVEQVASIVNVVVPVGWLPLGARALAEQQAGPALLGILGLGIIGTWSLWRSYRTTVRLYTGEFTAGTRRHLPAPVAAVAKADKPRGTLLEWDLRGISEQTTAIALCSFRSLTRAPEAKLMLLGPVILVVVFGSMFWTRHFDPPEMLRPLIGFGAISMVLLTTVQLAGNQFGFDRAGFRVLVLCPARRRDILLGKNLAFAPVAMGLGLVGVLFIEAFYPMRIDHLVAVLVGLVSMYLVYCLLMNGLSILGAAPISPGSLKPTNLKGIPLLLHLAFVLALPLALAPMLLPLGIEFMVDAAGWVKGMPVALVLSLAECAVVVLLYRVLLDLEGDLLQAREKKILEMVATRAE